MKNLDVSKISTGEDPAIKALSAAIEQTLSAVYGPGTHAYNQLRTAQFIDDTRYVMRMGFDSGPTPAREVQEGVARGRDKSIAILEQAAAALREELDLSGGAPGVTAGTERQTYSNDVFIVHGQDSPAKIEVARLVERAGLTAVILHEQANGGRTIIEKFEDHGGAAGFAIILLTPDDVGGPMATLVGALKPRARQNVIAEMGWFVAKLTRKRVCVLKRGDIEVPSDFAGVVYVEMDDRGAWKQEVLRELQAAGYACDWGRALS